MRDTYEATGGKRGLYGLENHREINPQTLARDVRRPETRFLLIVSRPAFAAIAVMAMVGMSWIWPWMVQIIWLIGALLAFAVFGRTTTVVLPLRLPRSSMMEDLNDPKPGRTSFFQARGLFYLGRDLQGNELWEGDKDVVTHFLVFGSTGSGKSEFLLALYANAIALGSGGIYSDAKATNKLYWQMCQLARRCGVDDQMLIVNYITGNVTLGERNVRRLSNTSNPFATGSADSAMQILGSLISTPEGDNAVFGQRAIALLSAVLFGLVDLRNAGKINLGVNTLRHYMNFARVYALGLNADVSERSRGIIRAYLDDLPGFDYGVPAGKQRDEVFRQFGFAVSYFTRALSSLSDTYGHIYWTDMGEVDMIDVVTNRRSLCILLPPMEKNPEELRNLGKISLAGVKGALAPGLGTGIEGTREDVLDNLPTASRVPYIIEADEYAYQSAEGFSVTAAQARGLNVIFVFAAQDFGGMKKASEEEALQIYANTKTKVGMAIDDVKETGAMLVEVGAKGFVAEVAEYERDTLLLGSAYNASEIVRVQERDRVNVREFQEMIEGELIIFFRGRVVRGDAFYPDVGLPKYVRINRFMRVSAPDPAMLPSVKASLEPLNTWFASRLDGRSAASTAALDGLLQATFAGARAGVERRDGSLTIIGAVMASKYEMDRRTRSGGSGSMGGMTPKLDAPVPRAAAPLPTRAPAPAAPSPDVGHTSTRAPSALDQLELTSQAAIEAGQYEDDRITDEDLRQQLARISVDIAAAAKLDPAPPVSLPNLGLASDPVPPAAAPQEGRAPAEPVRQVSIEEAISEAIRQKHVYPVPPEPSTDPKAHHSRAVSLLDAIESLGDLN